MANRRNYSTTVAGSGDFWNGSTWTKQSPAPRAAKASRAGSDYSRRKPKGWKAPTEYSMTEEINVEPHGSAVFYQHYTNAQGAHKWRVQAGARGICSKEVGENLSHLSWLQSNTSLKRIETFPSNLRSTAIQRAYSKLKGQNLNLGQAWAERGQTASLIEQSLARITRDVRNLRRNPLVVKDIARGANTLVKHLPDWWLEVVFGWKPLLSDIHGAVTELDNRPDDHYRVVGKGAAKVESRVDGIFPPSVTTWQQSDTAATFQGCFVRIDAVPSNEALVKASQLGLTNPLSLAWELLPWSFVVDWCIPIGPYFDNLDVPLGWDIKGMSVSQFSKLTLRRVGTSNTAPNRDYRVCTFGANYRKVILSRSNDVVLPYANLPRFKDPFNSAKRVGTALSLLGQAFRP